MRKDIVSSAKDYVRNLWRDLQIMHTENASEKVSLEERVINDFYLSFQFSQQDIDIHGKVLAYTAREYPIHTIKAILKDPARFTLLVTNLTLPQQHGRVRSLQQGKTPRNIIHDEFLDKWEDQYRLFVQAYDRRTHNNELARVHHALTDPEDELLLAIAYDMIRKDLKYVQEGRPNRKEQDKYESYLRIYGILKKSTGSELYDGLFVKLTTILQNPPADYFGIDSKIEDLAKVWESRHPDQKFFASF